MLNVIPFVIVSVSLAAPNVNLHAQSKDPVSCMKRDPSMILIAQKRPQDPHGDDPHGDDPNDEVHPADLPANEEQKANKAPRDVYPKGIPNGKEPYIP